MQVLRDPLGDDRPPRGAVLSIGNFDGVHLGHQAVLRLLVERSRSLGTVAVVMTFDPHPVAVLRPEIAPRLLTTLEQRLELIGRAGVDAVLVVPFTPELARVEAEDFVREVLVDRLAIREVYIGANFRFGADRRGDVALLERLGSRLAFVASGWPVVRIDHEVVSSTRVRRAVEVGNVASAARLLGRPVFIDGVVRQGRRLGRTIGFPTLNLAPSPVLHPARGVYITATHVPALGRTVPSVTNLGVRPTLGDHGDATVETHLLDLTVEAYGEEVRVFFLERLRDERRFDSPDRLREQILLDVEQARAHFRSTAVELGSLPRR